MLISDLRMASGNDWACLVTKAKDLTEKGRLEESLPFYRKALAIKHTDKLVRRIQKIEVFVISIIYGNRTTRRQTNLRFVKSRTGHLAD